MQKRLARAVLSLCVVGAGCGDGTGKSEPPPRPVETRSAERQRFDAKGAETLLVYKAGRVSGTGRLIASAATEEAPRLFPSPEATLIVFREIHETDAPRAAELGVRAGHAYLLVGDLLKVALDQDLLRAELAFEQLREVDLAATDDALARSFGLKMEEPPADAQNLAFLPGDDVRLPFFLWLR